MKLFLLKQNVNTEWDTFDSCVVAAESEEKARLIHPFSAVIQGANDWDNDMWANTPEQVEVKEIGTALDPNYTGVVIASFNAG